ncbi:MAG: TrmB family transcriptional regulator [Candidatus Nanoarchaeia archaeon]
MIEEKLIQIGLTSGEARVYLALIKFRESTVGPLSKESKVAYSKIYDVLSRLVEKGLASYIIKEKTKHYQAAPPERLSEYVEKRKQTVRLAETVVEELIPQLAQINDSDEEQTLLFTGFNGILSAYELLLQKTKRNEVIKFFSQSREDYDESVETFFIQRPQFRELIKRYHVKKKITWLGIYEGKGVTVNPEIMKVYKINFVLPGNVDISEECVLIISWGKKPKAIFIHSKEIASNFRRYFDDLFRVRDKFPKTKRM